MATLLYVAKAFWRSKGNRTLNAFSVRHRFLQSIDFTSAYFEKVAAPGKINLLKLYTNFKGFAETYNGEIVDVDDFRGEIFDSNGQQIIFGRHPTNQYSLGIIFAHDNVLIYIPKLSCWQSINISAIDSQDEHNNEMDKDKPFRILFSDGTLKYYSYFELRDEFRHISITN